MTTIDKIYIKELLQKNDDDDIQNLKPQLIELVTIDNFKGITNICGELFNANASIILVLLGEANLSLMLTSSLVITLSNSFFELIIFL